MMPYNYIAHSILPEMRFKGKAVSAILSQRRARTDTRGTLRTRQCAAYHCEEGDETVPMAPLTIVMHSGQTAH